MYSKFLQNNMEKEEKLIRKVNIQFIKQYEQVAKNYMKRSSTHNLQSPFWSTNSNIVYGWTIKFMRHKLHSAPKLQEDTGQQHNRHSKHIRRFITPRSNFEVLLTIWFVWSKRKRTSGLGLAKATHCYPYSFVRSIWLAAIFQFICISSITYHLLILDCSMNNLSNEIQEIGLVCDIYIGYIHSHKLLEFMLQGGLKEQANIWLNLETRGKGC